MSSLKFSNVLELCMLLCLSATFSQSGEGRTDRNPQNTYLPQLMAVSGVISTGERSLDEALQTAVAQHLQGWFSNASQSYAAAAALAPTNRDVYLGAAYTAQLRGCGLASRSLNTFLRLLREHGPQDRREVRCKRAPNKEHSGGWKGSAHHALRVWVDNGVFVSVDTFRSMADHVFDEYFCHFDPTQVQPGDIVFVNTFLLCPFFKAFHPRIAAPYALITHNSDFSAPTIAPGFDFSGYLESSRLAAQNHGVVRSEPVDSPPETAPAPTVQIAPRNSAHKAIRRFLYHKKRVALTWAEERKAKGPAPKLKGLAVNTKTFSVDWHPGLAYMAKTAFAAPDLGARPHWLYVNFRARGEELREAALAWAKQAEQAAYVTVREAKLSQEEFRREVSSHRYVLCPPGNGLDTHRVYEALQLGAIPVVFASKALGPLHARLPVLRVLDAQELSLTLLSRALPPLLAAMHQLWESEERSPLASKYWRATIKATVAQHQAASRRYS